MAFPKCPLCGQEALNPVNAEKLSTFDSAPCIEPDLIVCHCLEGHRFVISRKEYLFDRTIANHDSFVTIL